MRNLKNEIRKCLENITTYDHKMIVSELEKIDYEQLGFSDFDIVCDDRNNNSYTTNKNTEHIVFTTTILKKWKYSTYNKFEKIYIYHGKKKYIISTIYQDDKKKLKEERIKKSQRLNEKK